MTKQKTSNFSKSEQARLQRIENEKIRLKKLKQKKVLFVLIGVIVIILGVIGIIALINNSNNANNYAGKYYNETSNTETIILNSNGTFTANIPHSVQKSGKYTINNNIISFTADNVTESGYINGKSITIPEEWDDGHGHGTIYTK